MNQTMSMLVATPLSTQLLHSSRKHLLVHGEMEYRLSELVAK